MLSVETDVGDDRTSPIATRSRKNRLEKSSLANGLQSSLESHPCPHNINSSVPKFECEEWMPRLGTGQAPSSKPQIHTKSASAANDKPANISSSYCKNTFVRNHDVCCADFDATRRSSRNRSDQVSGGVDCRPIFQRSPFQQNGTFSEPFDCGKTTQTASRKLLSTSISCENDTGAVSNHSVGKTPVSLGNDYDQSESFQSSIIVPSSSSRKCLVAVERLDLSCLDSIYSPLADPKEDDFRYEDTLPVSDMIVHQVSEQLVLTESCKVAQPAEFQTAESIPVHVCYCFPKIESLNINSLPLSVDSVPDNYSSCNKHLTKNSAISATSCLVDGISTRLNDDARSLHVSVGCKNVKAAAEGSKHYDETSHFDTRPELDSIRLLRDLSVSMKSKLRTSIKNVLGEVETREKEQTSTTVKRNHGDTSFEQRVTIMNVATTTCQFHIVLVTTCLFMTNRFSNRAFALLPMIPG